MTRDPAIASPSRSARLPRMLPWVLFVAALAAAAYFGWRAHKAETIVDPIATGLVSFRHHNKLVVLTAQFAPIARNDDTRVFGLVSSRQVAVIPATVRYYVDLAKVGRDRLAWDAASQTLSVRLPKIAIDEPQLDEARAEYLRNGLWVTNDAQEKLTRANSLQAASKVRIAASDGKMIELAQGAAREAIRLNLEGPLRLAGFREAKVAITFD
ncbi:MAG: DUF4230 domain-containing protein [Novosphingobium meiothermophilum]